MVHRGRVNLWVCIYKPLYDRRTKIAGSCRLVTRYLAECPISFDGCWWCVIYIQPIQNILVIQMIWLWLKNLDLFGIINDAYNHIFHKRKWLQYLKLFYKNTEKYNSRIKGGLVFIVWFSPEKPWARVINCLLIHSSALQFWDIDSQISLALQKQSV